ncbi:MAG: hypothetical protein IE909_12195, partial [Campylobacterales bacterium]|nr:hypothetical protein [Campylobacterales bacterium]
TSSWDDLGVTDLPTNLWVHTATVHNNYLYVLGGYTGSSAINKTYRLDLNKIQTTKLSNKNYLFKNKNIPANDTFMLNLNTIIPAGTSIFAKSSTSGVVALNASGVQL